jgi:hypothetical protein
LPTLASRQFQLWESSCSFPVGWDQAQGLFKYASCYTGGVLFDYGIRWLLLFSALSNAPFSQDRPESGGFMLLKVFKYQSMGVT